LPLSDAIKRGLDLVVGSAALVLTSPMVGVSALGILLSMGRPVFFTQERAGLSGKSFRVLKFRTMRQPRADEDETASDADRLTRIGQLLRSTSLDELPTLLNVLKGDMSLVGPRPLLIRYLPRYSPRQARRHEVKPGVTGWAQVNGRNSVSWPEKLEMDVWYVENRSLFLDARILLRTVAKVLGREGISEDGAATMSEFMGSSGGEQRSGGE